VKQAFVDTSLLAAIAFGERTAHAARRKLAAFDTLAASPLLEAELRSLLRREGPEAERRVAPWLAGLEWVSPDRPLSAEIDAVLDAGYLRGADCWHVATALYLAPEPSRLAFLTLDARQAGVAKALGFEV